MTAYTAFNQGGGATLLQKTITQNAHGFGVGLLVIDDALAGPPDWITAKADSIGNSFATMMVSSVIDVNTFVVTQTGFVSGIVDQPPGILPFTPGANYYLSPTNAGQLTTIRPTSTGQIILPCFKAFSADSGFFFGGSGEVIESGEVFTWNTQTISTTLAVNQGYLADSGGGINLTLPATAVIGDVIRITNLLGGFSIRQNANQAIFFGQDNTTLGVAGHIDTTKLGDSIEMVCSVPGTNTAWQVLSSIGNFTIV